MEATSRPLWTALDPALAPVGNSLGLQGAGIGVTLTPTSFGKTIVLAEEEQFNVNPELRENILSV